MKKHVVTLEIKIVSKMCSAACGRALEQKRSEDLFYGWNNLSHTDANQTRPSIRQTNSMYLFVCIDLRAFHLR